MVEKVYHYTECGLDNIYLYGVELCEDIDKEKVYSIPSVNKLHKVIALGLITKRGLLLPKEIRFLRTLLGLKQTEFSELLGKEAQAVGRWERGDCQHDLTVDMFIKLVVLQTLNLKDTEIDLEQIKTYTTSSDVTDKINVDMNNGEYLLRKVA